MPRGRAGPDLRAARPADAQPVRRGGGLQSVQRRRGARGAAGARRHRAGGGHGGDGGLWGVERDGEDGLWEPVRAEWEGWAGFGGWCEGGGWLVGAIAYAGDDVRYMNVARKWDFIEKNNQNVWKTTGNWLISHHKAML